MTHPYRDEQAEIDHLEGPELELSGVFGIIGRYGPPHSWGPLPLSDAGKRCIRCGLTRWDESWGPTYQFRNKASLRMGAEPGCKPTRRP